MGRRRMHRSTRRFLLGLSAVVVCIVLAGAGVKWIFSSEPTELTGKAAPSAQGPATADTGAALRPLSTPGDPRADRSNGQTARPRTDVPEAPKTAARPKPQGEAVPVPPASQPVDTPRLSPSEAQRELEAGFAAREAKDLVAARAHLNKALHSGLNPTDEKRVREALADLAQQTLFSRAVPKDDPLVERYTVKSGDSLARIAKRHKVSENLLAEINGITNKNLIRAGTTLKVANGPFHAAVSKRDHKLHVYLQDVYIRSYGVALGMDGSTPTGTWKVINQLENPDWVDPNGKRWHANDPNNPIGEFWIGLEGIEGEAVGKVGFGIHGTIEPETIGQDVSLGCVRLAADDIAAVYKFLVPGASLTTITE